MRLQSGLDMQLARTVETELNVLRRSSLDTSAVGTALTAHKELYFEELRSLRRAARPDHIVSAWDKLMSRLRRITWMEFALLSLQERYYRRMLTSVVLGTVGTSQCVSIVNYRDHFKVRRLRIDCLLALVSTRRTDLETRIPDAERMLVVVRRARVAAGEHEKSEVERFYEDAITALDKFNVFLASN